MLAVALGIYGYLAIQKLDRVERQWQSFVNQSLEASQALDTLHHHLGFGGLIHKFKNYVLRQEAGLADSIVVHVDKITRAIEIYRALPISEAEKSALDRVERATRAYETRMITAREAVSQGMGTNEIDSLVIHNDEPAITALSVLSETQLRRSLGMTATTTNAVGDARRFITHSAVLLPAILLVTGLLIMFLQRTVQATAESISNESRFRDFTEVASDWFWEQDADLRFSFVSDLAFKGIGRQLQSLLGKRRDELWAEAGAELTPAMRDHLDTLRQHRNFRGYTYTTKGDDGVERVLRISGMAIFDDAGTFQGYRGVGHNITTQVRAEEALQEREHLFRTLYNKTPIMLHSIDNAGHLVSVSDFWLEHMGYARDEVIGRHFADFMTSESAKYAREVALPRYYETGVARDYEYQLVRKDGSIIQVLLSANAEWNDAGELTYSLAVIRDVTERREMESDLARLQEETERERDRLQSILDAIPNPLGVYDGDLNLSLFNAAFVLMYDHAGTLIRRGVSLEKIARAGMNKGNYHAADGWEEEYLQQRLEGIRNVGIEPHVTVSHFRDRWYQIVERRTRLGEIVGVRTDVTELMAAREDTERERDRLQSVLDAIPSAISVYTDDLRYSTFNQAFVDLYDEQRPYIRVGVSIEEMVRSGLDMGLYPTALGREEEWLAERLELQRSVGYEPRERLVKSRSSWLKIVEIKTELNEIVSVRTDVSELIASQEVAEAASRAKSEFLANMSHEIRTPMNAVLGLSQLALKTKLSAKQKDYLTKINDAAHALLGVINDILDFSKVEAGKLELETVDFELNAVFDRLAAVSLPAAESKGLTLHFAQSAEVPQHLAGDPLRLGQVLMNLVSNAIKFTEEGEVVIRVDVVERDSAEALLRFAVSDTGVGLGAERHERLFEAFTQADGSTTRNFGGTGLGLTISRQLVELMGGDIDVDSELGSGSTFHFTARFGIGDGTEVISVGARLDAAATRVLVVDDNETARHIMQEFLTAQGFPVSLAASGDESLKMMYQAEDEGQPYDLVLMDWRMPGMDGLAAVQKIRVANGMSDTPVVIMVTGYDRDELLDAASGVEIDAVLDKPVTGSKVIDTIHDLFAEQPGRLAAVDITGQKDEAVAALLVGKFVLLVEDNEINRQIGVEILAHAGVVVETAENGRIGVQMVMDHPTRYDAILMDVQMPVMDGLQATAAIIEGLGEAAPPILAMTAHAIEEERQRCFDAGMKDHIAKPVDSALLMRALARWTSDDASAVVDLGSGSLLASVPAAVVPADEPADEMPTDGAAVLDIAEAVERLGLGEDQVMGLLGNFRQRYAETMPELEAALAAPDLVTVKERAHALKGVSGSLGVMAVFELAKTLEQAAKDDDADAVAGLVPRLGRALAAVFDVIDGAAKD